MSEVINEEEWKVPFSIQPPSLTCQISFPVSMKLGCFPTFFRDSKYCACVEEGGRGRDADESTRFAFH